MLAYEPQTSEMLGKHSSIHLWYQLQSDNSVLLFETRSHYVAQAGFELSNLLSLLLQEGITTSTVFCFW